MGWNNNNAISFGSVGMVISGLITYVIAGKKALSENIKKN
jgi:hypothetical protein